MAGREASIENGLNTSVDHGGQRYHVQTQSSDRDGPVVESMVFQDGQTLVRITASYDDVAERLGFNGDDARHLLELQHADLIRKIRHGMLADDDPEVQGTAEASEARLVDGHGATVGLDEVEDPSVQQLLRDLGAAVDDAQADVPAPISGRKRWALVIRLPF